MLQGGGVIGWLYARQLSICRLRRGLSEQLKTLTDTLMTTTIPDDVVLDLHDLATILLRERQLSESRFRKARLRESSDGSQPFIAFPMNNQSFTWYSFQQGYPKAGYVLYNDPEAPDDLVELADFKHPDYTGALELTDKQLETIYWGAKHHDSGYLLAYVLQNVISALPESTKLRLRTSQGYEMMCRTADFAFNELTIAPNKIHYFANVTVHNIQGPRRADLSENFIGDEFNNLRWIYFVFGGQDVARTDVLTDGRVMLDLVTTMLGERGLGGEIFSMERMGDYHNRILVNCCKEEAKIIMSGRLVFNRAPPEQKQEAVELQKLVLSRLTNILTKKETFCAYCGRSGADSSCAKCKIARYCSKGCQTKAWKYHKVWCKIDSRSS